MSESDSERVERGREFIDKINHDTMTKLFERLNPVAPDFERLVLGGDIADIWDRDQLSLRERLIVRLGVAAAIGGPDSTTQGILAAALNVGISPEDIAEMFVQTVPQIGYIRLIASLEALQTALESRRPASASA